MMASATCPTCFEAFSEDRLPEALRVCGHVFCAECLQHWWQQKAANRRSPRDPANVVSCPSCRAEFRHADRLPLRIDFKDAAALATQRGGTPARRRSAPGSPGASPGEVPQSPAPAARLRAAQAEAQALRAEAGAAAAAAAEAQAARGAAEKALAESRAALQRAESARLRALSTAEALRLDLLSERSARADDGRRFDSERRSLEQLYSLSVGEAGGLEELQQTMVRSIRAILREENVDVERVVRTLCSTTHAKQKKQMELLARSEQEAAVALRAQADETRQALARASRAERALEAAQRAGGEAAARSASPQPPPRFAPQPQPAAPPRAAAPGPADRRGVPMLAALAPIGWGAGGRAGASSFIPTGARPPEEGTFIRTGADGRGGVRKVFVPLENAAAKQPPPPAAPAAKKAKGGAGPIQRPVDTFFSR